MQFHSFFRKAYAEALHKKQNFTFKYFEYNYFFAENWGTPQKIFIIQYTQNQTTNLPKLRLQRRAPGNRVPKPPTSSKKVHNQRLVTNNDILVRRQYSRSGTHVDICKNSNDICLPITRNRRRTEESLASPKQSPLWYCGWREIVASVRRVLRFPQYQLIGFRSGGHRCWLNTHELIGDDPIFDGAVCNSNAI